MQAGSTRTRRNFLGTTAGAAGLLGAAPAIAREKTRD